MKESPIIVKSINFSIVIAKYCEDLISKKKFVFANQLLRSGISIGANVFEAQHAESRSDFIHKMKVALKEASETLYWLTLYERMDEYEVQQKTISDLKEIMAILSRIIISSKKIYCKTRLPSAFAKASADNALPHFHTSILPHYALDSEKI